MTYGDGDTDRRVLGRARRGGPRADPRGDRSTPGTGSTRASRAPSTRRSPTSWGPGGVLPPGAGRGAATRRLLPRRGPGLPLRPPRTAVRSMEPRALLLGLARPMRSRPLLAALPRDGRRRRRAPNSGIANQAFYLLAEGGVNRTSGRRVEGSERAAREGRADLLPRLHRLPHALGHFRRRAGGDDQGRPRPLRRGGGGAGGLRLVRGGRRVS